MRILNIPTSCYFKLVTLLVRNLFQVGLPYVLLIRSYRPILYYEIDPASERFALYASLTIVTTCYTELES
jgi:hypothetical protein